jgi:hypothetical protein
MKLLGEKKIKIGDKEYPLKMTYRAMIEYEKLAGHSIDKTESLADVTYLFYCTVRAGGADITYDQFMDLIDDKMGILNEFSSLMSVSGEKKRTGR